MTTFAERIRELEAERERWPEWMKQWRRENPIELPDHGSETRGARSETAPVRGRKADNAQRRHT